MRRFLLPLLGLTGLLSGCASVTQSTDAFFGLITPYRIDIVQGNVVTKEQIAVLKPGMSRAQVRDVLGTPLVTDIFHGNRWDYIFAIRRPGTEAQRRSVVILFEGELVKSIDAPDLPSEREFVASIAKPLKRLPDKLELSDDERKALPIPAKPEPVPVEPTGPVREYPPLESAS
jgi:outer membrane protein assembly factor BamE